jgi:hypothetical protein
MEEAQKILRSEAQAAVISKSNRNVKNFAKDIENAPTDKVAEMRLRSMIEDCGKEECPMPLLVLLGRCILDYRRSELRDQAERN